MRKSLVAAIVVVASLAWALPAQAQLPLVSGTSVCVAGSCTSPPYVPMQQVVPDGIPHALLEMTVGQTLPALCAGEPETVHRVSEDVWVSTCPPERTTQDGCCKYVNTETAQPILRANAGGQTWTLVYTRRTQPAPCVVWHGSFVGLEQGDGSSPPKTGVWTGRLDYYDDGPYC